MLLSIKYVLYLMTLAYGAGITTAIIAINGGIQL